MSDVFDNALKGIMEIIDDIWERMKNKPD